MSNLPKPLHQPVMLDQAIKGLNIQAEAWYVDATFGRGGHTSAILQQNANVIAFDFDQQAIEYGEQKFAAEIAEKKLVLVRANFAQLVNKIGQLKTTIKIGQIKGILFDFGTTQDQLKSATRGFSFDQPDNELDMRMDQRLGVKASDLLMVLTTQQLADLFKNYGGESQAFKIAKAINRYRGKNRTQPITTVGQLTSIIDQVKARTGKLHPATKVFQALRIAVNDELSNIEQGLEQSLKILNAPARIVTIAFHQGEDRIAKQTFKKWAEQGQGEILTDKPLTASETEIEDNPASRSAKLRIFNLTTN